MILRILPLILLLFSLVPAGAAPEIFSDPRLAIEAARNENRLIIFFLADNFSKESKIMEKTVLEEVSGLEKEFVIVRCTTESRADRSLFADRFGKDLARAPMAVVSDPQGKEITGCYGTSSDLYRKMLIHSRIKGGFVKEKKEIEALRAELVADADEEELVKGIFGIKASDLRGEKLLLTGQRTWTFRSGTTFEAALLEGRGETGIFVEADGREKEVRFVELSEEDIDFLKTILTGGRTETPSE